jgi:hypothetical protein
MGDDPASTRCDWHIGQQLAAGIAVLALTTVTGTFAVYGLPGLMVTAVFGFSITRHPFTGAVVVGTSYCLLFVVFALGLGLASQLPLQVLILAIAIVAACVGGYTLERSQRAAFAQGLLISALRQRLDQLLHQYLSPEVASALIEDPARAALGGDEVEVTVLFADLRGYTAFAESTAPAQERAARRRRESPVPGGPQQRSRAGRQHWRSGHAQLLGHQ